MDLKYPLVKKKRIPGKQWGKTALLLLSVAIRNLHLRFGRCGSQYLTNITINELHSQNNATFCVDQS